MITYHDGLRRSSDLVNHRDMVQKGLTFIGTLIQTNYGILRERATSDFFSAMLSSKGYWYYLFYLDDTSFSLSQLFGVSIEELLDVFETIGSSKKAEKMDLWGEEDVEQQHLMEVELELLAEERSQLSLEYKKAKVELRERRIIFEEEASKPENSKVEG